MLLKDLIMVVEASSEPESSTNGNSVTNSVAPKKEAPIKPTKQKKLEKATADGVGNEAYDIAQKVSEFLGNIIVAKYKEITDVRADKGMVRILGAGKLALDEEFINVVQQYVTAAIGNKINNFDISGPFKSNNDAEMVFIEKT